MKKILNFCLLLALLAGCKSEAPAPRVEKPVKKSDHTDPLKNIYNNGDYVYDYKNNRIKKSDQ